MKNTSKLVEVRRKLPKAVKIYIRQKGRSKGCYIMAQPKIFAEYIEKYFSD